MASASEFDTVIKLLCKSIEQKKNPKDILEYYPVLSSKYPNFNSYKISIPRHGLILHPWEDWSASCAPGWWSKGYNKIKHQRDSFFKEANLINALNAAYETFMREFFTTIKSVFMMNTGSIVGMLQDFSCQMILLVFYRVNHFGVIIHRTAKRSGSSWIGKSSQLLSPFPP